MQSTNSVIVIRPANFGYNSETAVSNAFQNTVLEGLDNLNQKVDEEFSGLVNTLREKKINVDVIDDTVSPIKPDAIFPNNWISTHADGLICLYPMLTPNRQAEVRLDIVVSLQSKFLVSNVMDLTSSVETKQILEGTGSIIFDRVNQIAYACLSPRTNKELFQKLCKQIDYIPITFKAKDENGMAIYHTNVMMGIGTNYAIICADSIIPSDRNRVLHSLLNSGLELFEITHLQMSSFAGNVIELQSTSGKKHLALSQSAYNSLSETQISGLSKYVELLPISIPTIETIGGGSVRCMIAENFLPIT